MQSTRSRHKRTGGFGSTIAFLLLGILLLAGVAWYCYTQLVPHIEADLTERVTSELTSNGFAPAQVQVDGTDVTLSGNAESPAIAQQAAQIALSVYGVTNVQNNLATGLDNAPTDSALKDNALTNNNSDSAQDENTAANAANSDTESKTLVENTSTDALPDSDTCLLYTSPSPRDRG